MDHLRTYTALAFLATFVGACAPHHTPTHKGETAPALQCAAEAIDLSECACETPPEGAPVFWRQEVSCWECPTDHPRLADCRRLKGAAQIDDWLRNQ